MFDAEREALSFVTDEAALRRLRDEGITDRWFSTDVYRATWHYAVEVLGRDGQAPTPDMLEKAVPGFEPVEEQAGTLTWTIEQLRETYDRQTASRFTTDIAPYLRAGGSGLVEHVEAWVSERRREALPRIERVHGADDFQEWYFEQVASGVPAWSLGWERLDEGTGGGSRAGELVFTAGRAKSMKSWLLTGAYLAQIEAGQSPIFVTQELNVRETCLRLVALSSGVSYRDMYRRQLSTQDSLLVAESIKENDAALRRIYRVQHPTVAEILAVADQHEADSIIIDQLSFLRPSDGDREYRSDWERMASIVESLKLLAVTPGRERPVHVACQLNRENELARTVAIDQFCDTVFAIERTDEMKEQHRARVFTHLARSSGDDEWWFDYEFEKRTKLTCGLQGALPIDAPEAQAAMAK